MGHCKIRTQQMTANTKKNFAQAMKILEERGVLLVSGREIPDVQRLVTRQPIKGSWWGDPSGPEIFAVSEMLADHPDVTMTKLISGKVTFVHRQLWQKLVVVGNEREEWQTRKLTASAKLLLRQLDKNGSLLSHNLGSSFGKKPTDAVRELELKLLLHSEQFHTETGFHSKLLETWEHWAKRMGLRIKATEASRARKFLEKRLEEINEAYSGFGCLPWQPKRK